MLFPNRRRILKSLIILAVGSVILPVTVGFLEDPQEHGNSPKKRNVLTARVSYAAMHRSVAVGGLKSEDVTLSAPAFLNDLLLQLERLHPALVGMLPGMQTLLNSIAAFGNPQLRDGDEVSLIPLFAGG